MIANTIFISPTSALQAQKATTVLVNAFRKINFKLQVLDPVTLFVSSELRDLQTLNNDGTPQGGLQLGQGIYDFLAFKGTLYAACQVATKVIVLPWEL